jgi:hypothetical protein
MTDSNLKLQNNENTNGQPLETTLNNEQPSKTDLEFNKEIINSSFSNVFEQTNYTPDLISMIM